MTAPTHACGHIARDFIQTGYDAAARQRQIAAIEASDCPACRAKGSDLTGSAKQIAWATDLRAKAIPEIAKAAEELRGRLAKLPKPPHVIAAMDEAISAEAQRLLGRREAQEWIDARDQVPMQVIMTHALAAGKAADAA